MSWVCEDAVVSVAAAAGRSLAVPHRLLSDDAVVDDVVADAGVSVDAWGWLLTPL